jgi:hypothetical protein
VPNDTPRVPSYRLHKARGTAVVTLGGRNRYLGAYGSPESHAEYEKVVAEWLANGRCSEPPSASRGPTVAEVMVAYVAHADSYYVKNGQPTREVDGIKASIKPLRRLSGNTPAADFGPLALRAVREAMIGAKDDNGRAILCRNEVNKRVGRIVRMFKWAVANELVPAAVYQALATVEGLRKGRTDVRESKPVGPVPDKDVDAIQPFVSRQCWAMVELQRLTAMRPGEVVIMRTRDVDRSGDVWVYRPGSHKTEHHGRGREVYLGPRAQELLAPCRPGRLLVQSR